MKNAWLPPIKPYQGKPGEHIIKMLTKPHLVRQLGHTEWMEISSYFTEEQAAEEYCSRLELNNQDLIKIDYFQIEVKSARSDKLWNVKVAVVLTPTFEAFRGQLSEKNIENH